MRSIASTVPVIGSHFGAEIEALGAGVCGAGHCFTRARPNVPLSPHTRPKCFEQTISSSLSQYPVRFRTSSRTVSCWDPPASPETDMDSAHTYLDDIRVHCARVSTKALNSCGSGVPSHQIHTVQEIGLSLSSTLLEAEPLQFWSWYLLLTYKYELMVLQENWK